MIGGNPRKAGVNYGILPYFRNFPKAPLHPRSTDLDVNITDNI